MRHEPTPAENRLWQVLRAKRFHGVKFYQQLPIGDFIVDFASRSQMLIIELDGDTHADSADYDQRRTDWLQREGFVVLRFGNTGVMGNLDGVCAMIERHLRK